MRKNILKEKLARGEPCRGVWLGVPSSYSARILARLPIDFLWIDSEHAPVGVENLVQMTTAIIEANGPVPLVRIPQSSIENIKLALDAGAYGIVAPMINTPEEAQQVVTWSKYPPVGQRSHGSPYAGLAFGISMREYLEHANEQILTMIQIESKTALDHLDAILCVPGIDLAFIGPVDLAISLGLDPIAENTHPTFLNAIERIQRAAQIHNIPLGIYCSNGKAAAERIHQGFKLVNVASDIGLLLQGASAELEASK